jgi:23S rRNA (adenine1618-N6)-methyltransferase
MEKKELHPRNRHRNRYDFPALIGSSAELARHVRKNEYGDESVDFADPAAVKALNRAILRHFYGIAEWDVPEGYLCPPIPGRADYVHHVADLLARTQGNKVPTGTAVRVLDVGTGANLVYPLIGTHEYGWSFVGTEIDPVALKAAEKIIAGTPKLEGLIELRLQKDPRQIFGGVVGPDETFDLSICNPPFHESRAEAEAGSRRKWNNLGKAGPRGQAPVQNFGGTNAELWCVGGERTFISRMIEESAKIPTRVRWFTTLVAKDIHLPLVLNALQRAKVKNHTTIEMAQGQKKSRIVAWTFGP